MSSENNSEMDTIEAFERAIRESAASRVDTELIEIQEISSNRASVVVKEEESLPSGTLYEITKEPTLDDEFNLHWKYLSDTEID